MDGADLNDMLSEHRFWLSVMGDHARFLFYALAPNETGEQHGIQNFILNFDNLTSLAQQRLSMPDISELHQKAQKETRLFHAYKLQLLALLLSGRINIQLSGTSINHMVNETEEYQRLIESFLEGQVPLYYPIHYHQLWLLNAAGHAFAIASNLDGTEKDMLEQSLEYERLFKNLYLKSIELNGFMRTKLNSFPALERLNTQSEDLTASFRGFLGNLYSLCRDGGLLGSFTPLMADHMIREADYFILKLTQSVNHLKGSD